MKTPKLIQRKRDGIWEVTYYHNNKRIRKSLGTRDKIAAGISFTQLTGYPVPMIEKGVLAPVGLVGPVVAPVPVVPVQPIAPPPIPHTLYVDAVNEFIEAKWGIKKCVDT